MKRHLRSISQTVLVAILTMSATLRAEEPAISEEARSHFSAGINYIDDPEGPKYEEAYREFKAAYAASPSWKILGNLGTCAFYLERDGEAIDAYEKYLAQGGDQIPADERKQIEKDLGTLKTSLVQISLTIEPPNAAVEDERVPSQGGRIVNRYQDLGARTTLGIHPGHHRITVSAPGHTPEVWEFDAESGAKLSKSLQLEPADAATSKPGEPLEAPMAEPPPPEERGTPALVYIGLATTGALVAGATVTGLLALNKHDKYDELINQRSFDEDEADDARSTGKTLNIVTDVLIGAAILAGGATAYFYFDSKKAPAQDRGTASIKLSPSVGPSGAWMTVDGRF